MLGTYIATACLIIGTPLCIFYAMEHLSRDWVSSWTVLGWAVLYSLPLYVIQGIVLWTL
jgi:hypothetical protein